MTLYCIYLKIIDRHMIHLLIFSFNLIFSHHIHILLIHLKVTKMSISYRHKNILHSRLYTSKTLLDPDLNPGWHQKWTHGEQTYVLCNLHTECSCAKKYLNRMNKLRHKWCFLRISVNKTNLFSAIERLWISVRTDLYRSTSCKFMLAWVNTCWYMGMWNIKEYLFRIWAKLK